MRSGSIRDRNISIRDRNISIRDRNISVRGRNIRPRNTRGVSDTREPTPRNTMRNIKNCSRRNIRKPLPR